MSLPNRKSPRLHGYDYSNQNNYFVTICTKNKLHLFGEINHLNQYGKIAEDALNCIPKHFQDITIEKYVIMPNHIHAMIVIGCDGGAERSRPFPTVSVVLGLYKSGVSKRIHQIEPDIEIWQKSFHDRIIRNELEYQKIWEYIEENPLKWEEDCFFSPYSKS